jgi:hypothetical protein
MKQPRRVIVRDDCRSYCAVSNCRRHVGKEIQRAGCGTFAHARGLQVGVVHRFQLATRRGADASTTRRTVNAMRG